MQRHLVDTHEANCSGRETAVQQKRQGIKLGGRCHVQIGSRREGGAWTRKPSNDGNKMHKDHHTLSASKTCRQSLTVHPGQEGGGQERQ